ncbi:type II secretion system protein [Desulfuromusa kysingii]|nr:prepilin-type N-terminal cleavage/methylation domain-containing protein [Desulfuromusa kysingii]
MSQTGTLTSRGGFTLVELLVVIVILSLISFISVPLLSNNSERDEKLVVRRIAGTVKQLYNEATLTRDEHLLTFHFARNSLLAYRLRSSDGVIEKEPFGREVKLSPLYIRQVSIEGEGNFNSGEVTIRIFPLGWMEPTQLVLGRESEGELVLTFSPLTGAITIDDEQTAEQ